MMFARWMSFSRGVRVGLFTAAVVLSPALSLAGEGSTGLVFQKPSRPGKPASGAQFRSPAAASSEAAPAATSTPASRAANASTAGNPLRSDSGARVVATNSTNDSAPAVTQAEFEQVAARPIAEAPRPTTRSTVRRETLPAFATPDVDLASTAPSRRRAIASASIEPWIEQPTLGPVQQAGYCDCGEPTCGICEPACGVVEPGCDMEPACGVMDAGCGMEAACGIADPDCGMVGCGDCVNTGSDFWCFPVCLPRLKNLQFWGGVHGFKGPRDAPLFGGAGDGNFGFQEGVNIGGRAPLISRLFPQISYQLGYQAVQSQLSGLSDGTVTGNDQDRSQQFVTAGLFRRVPAGVQYGVAWDFLRDDFQAEADFQQLRYEISLKSRAGREFGFMGTSSTNDDTIGGVTYEAVDQYCGFIRCQFGDGGVIRFWGGATNDSEGLFGSDFIAPLNNRWSLQGGFNYLIPDTDRGPIGAREESWNLGMNLVWHYGCTAKKTQSNPHAPLFPVADNGYMFIDQVQ